MLTRAKRAENAKFPSMRRKISNQMVNLKGYYSKRGKLHSLLAMISSAYSLLQHENRIRNVRIPFFSYSNKHTA